MSIWSSKSWQDATNKIRMLTQVAEDMFKEKSTCTNKESMVSWPTLISPQNLTSQVKNQRYRGPAWYVSKT